MDSLPTDIYTIFVQYMSISDVLELSKMNKKYYERIWKNETVWRSKKLSLHKERSTNIPKHSLYYKDKSNSAMKEPNSQADVLKYAAKHGHEIIFLPLFRSILNRITREGARIRATHNRSYIKFDYIHEELCDILNIAYYHIIIGPYTDILLTLLEEKVNFLVPNSTNIPNNPQLDISYLNAIYYEEPDTPHNNAGLSNLIKSRSYGTIICVAVSSGRYDTAKLFLEKESIKIPYAFINGFCRKILPHPNIYLKLIKHNSHLPNSLLQECHKLADINMLNTLLGKHEYKKEHLIIHRWTLKKLIRNKHYNYILYFMRFCHTETIKDVAELANSTLRQKISKDKKLTSSRPEVSPAERGTKAMKRIDAINNKFAKKSDLDSKLEDSSENKRQDIICDGKTLAGKRCTRKVSKGRYCWQHKK